MTVTQDIANRVVEKETRPFKGVPERNEIIIRWRI